KANPADSTNFALRVAQLIHRNGFAVLVQRFVFSKVNTAGQFPDDEKINAFVHNLLLQRGSGGQLGPDFCGAVVAVDTHSRPEPEQSLFRTHVSRYIIPLGAAYGAQQYAV